MSEKIHLIRFVVGLAWTFMGLIISGIFSEHGYGIIESMALGLVAVPVFILAVYVTGAIGVWVATVLNIPEKFGGMGDER